MKCKMVRFHTMTQVPEMHSRAERAVILKHFETCEKCCKWLDSLPGIELTPEEDKQIDQEMEEMLASDMEDPEFRSIVGDEPHPLQGPHNRTGSR